MIESLGDLHDAIDWEAIDTQKLEDVVSKENLETYQVDGDWKRRFRCQLLLASLPKEMGNEEWDKDRQVQARLQLKRMNIWPQVLMVLYENSLIDPNEEEEDGEKTPEC